MVAFVNFGPPSMADLINQYAFDAIMGAKPVQTFEERLALYEQRIADHRERIDAVHRTANTRPSHPLDEYAGAYGHAGYGEITIRKRGRKLILKRHDLTLSLRHWHYDTWVAEDNDRWTIHSPHPFDRASPIQFHTGARGAVAGLSIQFEPEVAPIQFAKQRQGGR